MQADGGWARVVWMPKDILERINEYIPEDILPKIATEDDVFTLDELKEWLKAKNHPITERWTEETVKVEPAPVQASQPVTQPQIPMTGLTVPSLELPASALPIQGLPQGVAFKIILKNAKIKAEKLIIRSEKE